VAQEKKKQVIVNNTKRNPKDLAIFFIVFAPYKIKY